MSGETWRVEGAGKDCPKVVRGAHKPVAGQGADNADLIAYSGSAGDAGMTVYLYRCGRCGVPLVGLAPLGAESDDKRVVWLAAPDAVQPEE